MAKLKAYIIALLLFTSGYTVAYAQDSTTVIDDKNINTPLLASLFLQKLNTLRTGLKLNALGSDSILAVAAEDQADYMNKTGIVGHTQTTKNKNTPYDRVAYYKGTNGLIGENCIQIILHDPYKNKQGKTVIVNTYGEAAEALFDGWKHSPPHYKNMITPYYDVQGVNFSFDAKTNKFYSTEVFGTEAYHPPKNFKVISDAWGVKSGGDLYPDFFSKDLANFIELHHDSIFLYYSNLDYFQQYIKSSDDGIAVDIVAREQFNCNHNNNLHSSPVFDGWMLKPVYQKEIIKNNRYKDRKELFTLVGIVPKELHGRLDLQYNVILIKNKRSAGYSYPIFVDYDNLQMLHLATYWDTTQGEAKTDSFNVTINHYIEFRRNEYKLNKLQLKQLAERVSQYLTYIKNIRVQTFSSIEGTTEGNIRLQQERANEIKKALSGLTTKNVDIEVEAAENWDAFFNQIEGTDFEYLKNLSKEDIKNRLHNTSLLDSINPLLSKERTAIVCFSIKGKLNNESTEKTLRIELQNAITQNDAKKAWIIQSEMIRDYLKGNISIHDIIDNDVPLKEEFLPLLSNIIAAKAVNINYANDKEFALLVRKSLKIGKDFAPLKLSYCVCAINYLGSQNDTLISNKRLEAMLHSCAGSPSLSASIWKYYLDYYVAGAYYNWTQHQYNAMDSCLEGIKKYYPKAVLADTDYIKLGKLFNMYYRSSWTIDMLYPIVKKGTSNEDLLFLFITTAPMFLNKVPQAEYIKYLKQARAMDKDRFCEWISDGSWQLLRVSYIKQLFCEQCNSE